MKDLLQINENIKQFARDRNWEKFHTPKNLSMAIAGEVGELIECFQWLTAEESMSLKGSDKKHVEEEIADVAIYLLRLCQVLNIDLLPAISDKMEKNAQKYPVADVYER